MWGELDNNKLPESRKEPPGKYVVTCQTYSTCRLNSILCTLNIDLIVSPMGRLNLTLILIAQRAARTAGTCGHPEIKETVVVYIYN